MALDSPDAGNDGKVGLRRYFKCADQCGVFSRRWRIEVIRGDPGMDGGILHEALQPGAREGDNEDGLGDAKVPDDDMNTVSTDGEAERGHKSPSDQMVKRSTPPTVVRERTSSPLQFEFSDEDGQLSLYQEDTGIGASDSTSEPVRIQELMPVETHRRSPASRRRSARIDLQATQNHQQHEPLSEHHYRRRTPTPADAPQQPGDRAIYQSRLALSEESAPSDPEFAPPRSHSRSPGRSRASGSPYSSYRSNDPRYDRRPSPRHNLRYDTRPDPRDEPMYDYHHSESRNPEPSPSFEVQRGSPVPRSPYDEPLNIDYANVKSPRSASKRTPKRDGASSVKKPRATPRRSSFKNPHVASPQLQTERTPRRRKRSPSVDTWQPRRSRTPSPRRARARFPVEHPRTALRNATSMTDTKSKAATTSATGRTLPWEKRDVGKTPRKGRRRLARSMSPGRERPARRLSSSNPAFKQTAHGRELPWSPHPRSTSPFRERPPSTSPTPMKMRIKDVREAREKAEKQEREQAEEEAKRETERETRLECERQAETARRNDALLRDAKEKKEKQKQIQKEKAIMKARLDAQKVAQTVRKARSRAAEEEEEELQRQEYVRREASARMAKLQAEKAEKKARAEAQQLQQQLKEAQEAVKKWERAEAQRKARAEREFEETSAQKQRVCADWLLRCPHRYANHNIHFLKRPDLLPASHCTCYAHIYARPTAFISDSKNWRAKPDG